MELVLIFAPLVVVVLLVLRMFTYRPDPEVTKRLMAQQAARLAKQAGLRSVHTTPAEVRKDILRKEYKQLASTLTPEDLDWVTEQMKLTGFDPTRPRYSVDSLGNPYLPSGRFPGGVV